MPKSKLVVSDTSPLLNLSLINRLELLEEQFHGLKVPNAVWLEIQSGKEGKADLKSLKDEGFIELVQVERDNLFKELIEDLDVGEAAAIRYAIKQSADLVLLDEKEGRRKADKHGLKTTGVIGILLKANAKKDLDIQRELDSLREAGFWISDKLYRKIIAESK